MRWPLTPPPIPTCTSSSTRCTMYINLYMQAVHVYYLYCILFCSHKHAGMVQSGLILDPTVVWHELCCAKPCQLVQHTSYNCAGIVQHDSRHLVSHGKPDVTKLPPIGGILTRCHFCCCQGLSVIDLKELTFKFYWLERVTCTYVCALFAVSVMLFSNILNLSTLYTKVWLGFKDSNHCKLASLLARNRFVDFIHIASILHPWSLLEVVAMLIHGHVLSPPPPSFLPSLLVCMCTSSRWWDLIVWMMKARLRARSCSPAPPTPPSGTPWRTLPMPTTSSTCMHTSPCSISWGGEQIKWQEING